MSVADSYFCGSYLLLNKIRLGVYKYCNFFSSGNHKWKILLTVWKENIRLNLFLKQSVVIIM